VDPEGTLPSSYPGMVLHSESKAGIRTISAVNTKYKWSSKQTRLRNHM